MPGGNYFTNIIRTNRPIRFALYFTHLARGARLSRFIVEPGISRAGVATARWPGALLARPAFLQARAARGSGGVASGLFVLDENDTLGSPNLLDRAGRFHDRERLPELCAGKPQVAGLAETGSNWRDGRNPQQPAG